MTWRVGVIGKLSGRIVVVREAVRSYLHSCWLSWRTGNVEGLRPKILSYHHNVIRLARGARLVVDGRVHLATRHNTWPSSVYIELGRDSLLHFTGRASLRGEGRIIVCQNAKVTIGNHCILRERIWLAAHEEITIGDGTGIGQDTMIIDSDVHAIVAEGQRRPVQGPVRIGERVWIGAHCIILKGVTIGSDTVIGAGSLVTRHIPDHVVAFGRPARVQRKINTCYRGSVAKRNEAS